MEVKDVCFSFNHKTLLHQVSFQLPNPAIFGLIGPNGAGKTTLLSILAGIRKPQSGAFLYEEKPGLLLQNTSLYEEATGKQNLAIFCTISGVDPHQIPHALNLVQIDTLTSHKKYKTYSQGLKQRLLIARAFLSPAKLILLDEPFNAVDVPTMIILKKSIRTIATDEQKTIVISSHHLKEIDELLTSGIILNKGKVIHQFTHADQITSVDTLSLYINGDADRLCTYLLATGYRFTRYSDRVSLSGSLPIWPVIQFCEQGCIAIKRLEYGPSLEDLFVTLLEAHHESNPD